MRSQQPSRTVVDHLVDEIPLRVEGRSCDEHFFRTESDPERTSVSSSPTEELAPVAPTGADDDDEQAERQVDSDDLADAVEAGAGARPVFDIDGAFERQPRAVEQPDEQRDHQPADHLHQMDVQADTGKAAEGRKHHPVAADEQQQDRHPHLGKEFMEGDPHQLQALRRLERAERRAQTDIDREHAADPDNGAEYVQGECDGGHERDPGSRNERLRAGLYEAWQAVAQ
jgi:hypothetical protein